MTLNRARVLLRSIVALFVIGLLGSGEAASSKAYEADWTTQYGTAASDYVTDLALHPSGVYVAGGTGGELPGQVSAGSQDAYVRRYSSGGEVEWTRQFGSAKEEEAMGVAVDDTGVYVVGQTYDALPGYTNTGRYDAFVRKYSLLGDGARPDRTARGHYEDCSQVVINGTISTHYVNGLGVVSMSEALPAFLTVEEGSRSDDAPRYWSGDVGGRSYHREMAQCTAPVYGHRSEGHQVGAWLRTARRDRPSETVIGPSSR